MSCNDNKHDITDHPSSREYRYTDSNPFPNRKCCGTADYDDTE